MAKTKVRKESDWLGNGGLQKVIYHNFRKKLSTSFIHSTSQLFNKKNENLRIAMIWFIVIILISSFSHKQLINIYNIASQPHMTKLRLVFNMII